MAIVACQDCGGTVSDRAAACPHCAAPMTDGARVTTQGTGKGIKLLAATSIVGLLIFAPWSLMSLNSESYLLPLLGCGACLAGLLFARAARWWQHS